MSFAPCPSCRRHVRIEHGACPFCAATLEGLTAKPAVAARVPRRLLAVAASALVAGCGVPVYGAPSPPDSGSDASSDAVRDASSDAGGEVNDSGSPAALYGNVPVDSGP